MPHTSSHALNGAQASRLFVPAGRATAKMALGRAQRARRVRLRRKQPNQSNPTTWRLAAMNMAIRGIDFDFGKEPADTLTRDQHPDLRAEVSLSTLRKFRLIAAF